MRWFQYGTFCPVMRMHGDRAPLTAVTAADGSERMHTGAPNELWSYGEDAYEILRKFVDIREALRPYLRTLMQSAHTDGQPIIRGLFHEFPEQDRAWLCNDQYMLGSDLLVAPVLHPGATERTVWLPEGVNWVDLRDGTVYEGGTEITSPAPLNTLPVFTKQGHCEELLGML